MPPDPYYGSASGVIDESKKNLLTAVAQAGTAGKQAYDAAQAQAAQAKQDAVGRAAERSALYGVGGDNQTFLGAYDSRMNQMNVNRSNFESGLAQTQASGDSYMEKARAAIPVHQAVNINKVADTESKIKTMIEAAKAKAEAAAAAEAAKIQREIDRENRADERAIMRENRADSRSAAKEAAKEPKLPTANQLMGQGQSLADTVNTALKAGRNARPGTLAAADAMGDVDNAVFLANETFGGVGPSGVTTESAARAYARALGMDEGQINSVLTPMVTGQWSKATAPAKDAYAQSLATKYDTKGVTYDTAKSAVNGEDFNTFTKWIIGGADGMTRTEAEDRIRRFFINGEGRRGGNPGPWVAEYEILMGEYVPRLPEE